MQATLFKIYFVCGLGLKVLWLLDINFPYCVYRTTQSIPVSPLRPNHVAEYIDRFDQLQRSLGLSSTKPSQ